MAAALFTPDGDAFRPTSLTRSFWSEEVQHGGPPVGLLARAIERVPTSVPMQVVRLTVDLYRPVPIDSPIYAETHVVRDGRRIQVVDASLFADGGPVARASALKIRMSDVPIPRSTIPWASPPGPDEAEAISWERPGVTAPTVDFFHITQSRSALSMVHSSSRARVFLGFGSPSRSSRGNRHHRRWQLRRCRMLAMVIRWHSTGASGCTSIRISA